MRMGNEGRRSWIGEHEHLESNAWRTVILLAESWRWETGDEFSLLTC